MNSTTNAIDTTKPWTLTECPADGTTGQTASILATTFTVGRVSSTALTVPSNSVSKNHAVIEIVGDGLKVRDLGSTNGTFVNGERISEAPLTSGDLVQFADAVYRVGRPQTEEFGATVEGDSLPWAMALVKFEELMNGEGVVPNFQPIVELPSGKTTAYELLARSSLEGLENPYQMFTTAARLAQESALSELMRVAGVRDALQMPDCGNLFLNTHPKEIIQPRFLESLRELREIASELPITIELHEGAVTEPTEMREFKTLLDELDMQLAYDDFGAGQARLDELSEVPPHFLKFDIKFIRGIDQASAGRQGMVATLVRLVRELGVHALAEGVETASEAETCIQLGFDFAQGYHYGRPAPREAWEQ